ncbi:MAG TPA: hypothetical protein VM871_01205, partial [Flavisolibacter sp.]|nr:hypothetical protein [Flavisolibacter sp.]
YLFLVLITIAVMSSCKRENSILEKGVLYNGPIQVTFNNYEGVEGSMAYKKAELVLKDSLQDANVEIKLANTTGTAPTDIYVYLTKVDAIVSNYNTVNGGALTPLSNTSDAIVFDFSKPVVIKQGTRKTNISLKVNPGKFDLSKQNAIGIGILRVEGGGATISSTNQSKVVVEFGARNKYDGVYRLLGIHNRPTYEFRYDQTMHLISQGESSVIFFWPEANSVGHPIGTGPDPSVDVSWYGPTIAPVIVFNTANNVVSSVFNNPPNPTPITRFDGATGTNVSRYESGTKRIIVHWNYNNNPQRAFFDTLTYIGPR